MKDEKPEIVRHKHSFELGVNVTYALVVLGIIVFVFAMSYFNLWGTIK